MSKILEKDAEDLSSLNKLCEKLYEELKLSLDAILSVKQNLPQFKLTDEKKLLLKDLEEKNNLDKDELAILTNSLIKDKRKNFVLSMTLAKESLKNLLENLCKEIATNLAQLNDSPIWVKNLDSQKTSVKYIDSSNEHDLNVSLKQINMASSSAQNIEIKIENVEEKMNMSKANISLSASRYEEKSDTNSSLMNNTRGLQRKNVKVSSSKLSELCPIKMSKKKPQVKRPVKKKLINQENKDVLAQRIKLEPKKTAKSKSSKANRKKHAKNKLNQRELKKLIAYRAKIVTQAKKQLNVAQIKRRAKRETEPQSENKCEYCHETFWTPGNLLVHQRIHKFVPVLKKEKKNTEKFTYKCDICSQKFLYSTSLIAHSNIHKGQHMDTCNVCGKKFRENCNLRVHLRLHTEDSLWHCDQCQFKSTSFPNFTKHQLKHTGERPFACSKCNKTFNRASSLKTHLKSLHDYLN